MEIRYPMAEPSEAQLAMMPDYQTADECFRQLYFVSPMVAAFIALPLKRLKSNDTYLLFEGERPRDLILKPSRHQETSLSRKWGEEIGLDIPYGMRARRILLLFFHHQYLNPDTRFIYSIPDDSKSLGEALGYEERKSRHSDRVLTSLIELSFLTISFLSHELNEKFGFVSLKQRNAAMFNIGYDFLSNQYNLSFNPEFLFKNAFPVDYNHVVNLRKKSDFWDTYLFLVDVLPRIKPRNKVLFQWYFIHELFRRDSTLANFKYHFKKTLEEVYNIYPKAKGRIDTSDKKYLICRYTPSPI